MSKPFVFVHVPKTAGTSFRLGASKFFGEDKICKDYGGNSQETSEIVKQYIRMQHDKWKFKCAFDDVGYKFLTGHYQSESYAPIFGTNCMVTFVRDPIQRIISEYNHVVENYGYDKSFKDFFRTPHNINRQHKILGKLLWSAIGFIGLTEKYAESLKLFNDIYGLDIPNYRENIRRKYLEHLYEVPEEHLGELCSLNELDINLYDLIKTQFKWRAQLVKENKKYVHSALRKVDQGRLHGWAFVENGNEPVLIQAKVGEKIIDQAIANQDRPWLRGMGVSRGGYVGFSLDISNLKTNDKVECIVADTGQPLAYSPWTI